jgi:hypothetical protein
MTVILTSVVIALLAGIWGVSSNTEAAMSMSAAVSRFEGLVQPDEMLIALANCELTSTFKFVSAGLICHVGGLG